MTTIPALIDAIIRSLQLLEKDVISMEHRAIAAETAHDSANTLLVKAEEERDANHKLVLELRGRVCAFAGQLQAWNYGEAAENLIVEVLGDEVNAPDYYALKEDNTRLAEVIEHARVFIRNGLEFGYIQMPDSDTPDPAKSFLGEIETALKLHNELTEEK